MKKVRGSALLWCLAVLVVLSVITLTAVGLSVSYYKSCVRKSGDYQAEYNSASAMEMLKDQIQSNFGGKQIYFTYQGANFLDSAKSRATGISANDRIYFSGIYSELCNSTSKEYKYLCAVRKLENNLLNEYFKSLSDPSYVRRSVRYTFNYGRIDTSVYNPGYYGDTADLYIEKIEPVDEDDDGQDDYYIAVIKAETVLNSGHRATVGAQFKSQLVPLSGGEVPSVSCKMMYVGISPETEPVMDEESGEEIELKKYRNASGIVLGTESQDGMNPGRMFIYGDAVASYSNLSAASESVPYKSIEDFKKYGFVKTDGYFSELGVYTDEVSYLDGMSGEYRLGNNRDTSVNGRYAEIHNSAEYTEEYRAIRGTAYEHGSGNIITTPRPDETPFSNLREFFTIPAVITADGVSNNPVKRYYVTSGGDEAPYKYYNNKSSSEYSMGFSQFVELYKTNGNPDASIKYNDKHDTASLYANNDLICCIVEKRFRQRTSDNAEKWMIDPEEVIELENIKLENGKTYFFRIRQNTTISFDESCYAPGLSANVYFQLCDDSGCCFYLNENGKTRNYSIDLKLVNPPENINIYAFDYSGGSTTNPDPSKWATIKPQSNAGQFKDQWYDVSRNVTVVVNNDTPDNYTLSGYYSCYRMSVIDETVNTEDELLASSQRNVRFRYAEPQQFISITDQNSALNLKNYTWTFEKYVDV